MIRLQRAELSMMLTLAAPLCSVLEACEHWTDPTSYTELGIVHVMSPTHWVS